MKIYITAQALQKNEIMQDIHRKSDVIIEHLLKLIVMPNHDARNHWQSEIAAHLRKIPKLKNKNKYPSAELLYTWAYLDYQDVITDVSNIKIRIREIEEDYNIIVEESPYKISNKLNDVCQQYFDWLSKELSLNGYVTNHQIYTKLDSIV